MKDVESLALRDAEGGAIVGVKVVPGSSRDRVVGVLGDALKIATSAAPEKGKANASVARTLARALGVGRRGVVLVSGMTSPHKEFRVVGLGADKVREILSRL